VVYSANHRAGQLGEIAPPRPWDLKLLTETTSITTTTTTTIITMSRNNNYNYNQNYYSSQKVYYRWFTVADKTV
jgi:hypothetical protein